MVFNMNPEEEKEQLEKVNETHRLLLEGTYQIDDVMDPDALKNALILLLTTIDIYNTGLRLGLYCDTVEAKVGEILEYAGDVRQKLELRILTVERRN